jgi:ribulose-phosphate 3-epimerase
LSWWRRPAEGGVAIAPSLLAADFARLDREIASLAEAGANLLHLDLMDGHFVPDLTFGPLVIGAIRRCTELPLDAHLMVSRPDSLLAPLAHAGVDAVTVHVECGEATSLLEEIGRLELRRGLSLKPDTDLSVVQPHLAMVDLLLVMSVEPGRGGQRFQPAALDKIRELVRLRKHGHYGYEISVDGGIDADTGGACRRAGADILVSGTYVLGAADRRRAVTLLRG